MIIIDPLKNRLLRYMKMGYADPRSQALSGYPADEDLDHLNNVLQPELLDDSRTYAYIDLTPPFVRFSRQLMLINSLSLIKKPRPVIIVKNESFIEWLKDYNESNGLPIIFVLFDFEGFYIQLIGGGIEDREILPDVEKDMQCFSRNSGKTYADLRKSVAQQNLYKCLVKANCIEIPRFGEGHNPENIIPIVGKPYKKLRNEMLVSCYLNLKYMGLKLDYLMDVVYEIFLNIEDYFIEESISRTKTNNHFKYIVTTNNTALFIASLLQTIYENKTLVPIDKLGPIPSLRLHSDTLKELLQEKNVILLEEVVGTGSEVDRAIMFLNHMHANIIRIIAVYDLKVGKPLLLNDTFDYFALCTPREDLKYEYRSK